MHFPTQKVNLGQEMNFAGFDPKWLHLMLVSLSLRIFFSYPLNMIAHIFNFDIDCFFHQVPHLLAVYLGLEHLRQLNAITFTYVNFFFEDSITNCDWSVRVENHFIDNDIF